MATVTHNNASINIQPFKPIGGGHACVAHAETALAAGPSAADIYLMCKVPAGAVIYGGWLYGDEIDSNASATLEIDVGTSADADALLDSGVITGETVALHLPTHADGKSFLMHFNGLADGVLTVTAATTIQCTFTAAAATFAAGNFGVVVNYYVP